MQHALAAGLEAAQNAERRVRHELPRIAGADAPARATRLPCARKTS